MFFPCHLTSQNTKKIFFQLLNPWVSNWDPLHICNSRHSEDIISKNKYTGWTKVSFIEKTNKKNNDLEQGSILFLGRKMIEI